jgi:hypothetical protein
VTEREEGQRVSRLVGGAVLVLIGGLLFLANLGVIERMRPGDFWPMLLIWVGATRIFAPSRSGHVSSGVLTWPSASCSRSIASGGSTSR